MYNRSRDVFQHYIGCCFIVSATTCQKGEYWCSSSTDGNPICITEADACETSVDNCPEASESGALCT